MRIRGRGLVIMTLKPPWEFDNPLCAELGPTHYFAEDDELEVETKERQQIRKLCNTCEHQFDCAEWGIYKEKWGIWGGLTVRERRLIRRRRKAKFPNEELSILYRE